MFQFLLYLGHESFAKKERKKKMKKKIILIFTLAMAVAAVDAGITYEPYPADMYDLDHGYYYIWGIDLASTGGYNQGDEIISAQLNFTNIRNYNSGSNVLYIHLLDDADVGLYRDRDNQLVEEDFFGDWAGDDMLIAEWRNDPAGVAVDLTLTFDADMLDALNTYAANDIIGFGVDPDCHFYNDGVEFSIETAIHAPAPGAVFLGSVGVVLVGWLRRRRRRRRAL